MTSSGGPPPPPHSPIRIDLSRVSVCGFCRAAGLTASRTAEVTTVFHVGARTHVKSTFFFPQIAARPSTQQCCPIKVRMEMSLGL